MAPSTKDAIVELLGQGKSSGGIVAMGFKKGTVYGAQRQWRQRKVETSVSTSDKTASPASNHAPQSTTASPDLESDPEILGLKKEIRKAQLLRELGITNAPLDVETLVAVARQLGEKRRHKCLHQNNGVCTAWRWSTAKGIPEGIGEPVQQGEDKWRIRPSPLYCALCVAGLESSIYDIPISGLRRQFTCDCGTKQAVAVLIKCTKCDVQTWWGWHPNTS